MGDVNASGALAARHTYRNSHVLATVAAATASKANPKVANGDDRVDDDDMVFVHRVAAAAPAFAGEVSSSDTVDDKNDTVFQNPCMRSANRATKDDTDDDACMIRTAAESCEQNGDSPTSAAEPSPQPEADGAGPSSTLKVRSRLHETSFPCHKDPLSAATPSRPNCLVTRCGYGAPRVYRRNLRQSVG